VKNGELIKVNIYRRVLVIQLKRAGDVLVTTPVLAALSEALPQVEIDFLVDKPFASLLEASPHLKNIWIYDRQKPWKTAMAIRHAHYDVIFDFQSSPRSILIGLCSGALVRAGYKVTFWGRFLTHAMKRPNHEISVTEGKMNLVKSVIGGIGKAGAREIVLTEAEKSWGARHMNVQPKGAAAIGLIPTHRRRSRRWPAESFAQLAKSFVKEGHRVWLFWGPGEEDYVKNIQKQVPESVMIPKTSLREMAALLAQCRLVVTNDNGPMHLATAVHVPTITLYGPTDPIAWNPGGPLHRLIQATGLGCLGCNLNECPFNHECMTGITPDRVLQEARGLL
jgi:lipopolysaccharide heptosyltransferase II